MRRLVLGSVLLALASWARANVLVAPWQDGVGESARMAGETVYAKMTGDSAEVSGVYELTDWSPGESIYVPFFSDGKASRYAAFVDTNMVVRIDGVDLPGKSISEPPATVWKGDRVPGVVWVRVNSDGGTAPAMGTTKSVRISVDYVQPLIDGKFLYLPVLPTRIAKAGDVPRSWPYQLIIRNLSHVPKVDSDGIDFERVGETVVVYLRDRQVVAIK